MKPLFKWAGGKQWLAPTLVRLFDLSGCDRLVEPFVGGASLFFGLESRRAILSDVNADLIKAYKAVKKHSQVIGERLQQLEIAPETYYELRASRPSNPIDSACRTIYLNRTAFGGIWRVNKKGEFNVPFGCKPETRLPSSEILSGYARILRRAALRQGDFESCLRLSGEADFIYCDPPYTVSHNNNGFLRYNEQIFSWQDQRRLARICTELARAGHKVVISNAAHADVMALYGRRWFHAYDLSRPSNLASKPEFRVRQTELLLVSNAVGRSRDIERELRSPAGYRVAR